MTTRRTPAQKLAEERAALAAKMKAIQEKLDAVDVRLTPAQKAERDEENEQLGVVARLLIADDRKLKGRFIAKASEVYRKDNRHRKAIQRVIGPLAALPVVAPEPPKSIHEDSDLGEFVRTSPMRPAGDNLDAAE